LYTDVYKRQEKWHTEFEKLSPVSHQEFLEGLGISKEEIEMIRKWSRGERI